MTDNSTAALWEKMHGHKSDLLERCEQYAKWTVASLFPEDDNKSENPEETQKGNVAIGARLVNHLAHRIVDTMFPNDRPFFALALSQDAQKELAELPEDARKQLQSGLMEAENAGMRNMDLTAYRPVAVNAVSLQIVTGNALIHRLPDGTRVVYSIRDYCVSREIDGKLVKVMLRDAKMYGNLPAEIQEQVQANAKNGKKYNEDTPVSLYTYYFRKEGKWHVTQALDEVELDTSKSYNDVDFPCLVLTWNLGRGDNYGRGLVEDHAVSFHNIDVMTEAKLNMVGAAANIKFLVNPASSFDVEHWNNAPPGSYVSGNEGDISVPQFKFAVDVQVIEEATIKIERELAQAFLLSSAGVRDAERVTAEEIRFFAREIESAYGGLYSRLALDWQRKEAEYQLSQIDFKLTLPNGDQALDVVVTTGLESLSREGKLDNLRLAIQDLQLLEAVPEELRAAFDPVGFANFVFSNRNVDATQFVLTQEQFTQKQQAEAQQQEQLLEKQGEVAVASKAAAE